MRTTLTSVSLTTPWPQARSLPPFVAGPRPPSLGETLGPPGTLEPTWAKTILDQPFNQTLLLKTLFTQLRIYHCTLDQIKKIRNIIFPPHLHRWGAHHFGMHQVLRAHHLVCTGCIPGASLFGASWCLYLPSRWIEVRDASIFLRPF